MKTTPLAEQTPQQIDTVLAAIYGRLDEATFRLDQALQHLTYAQERQAKLQTPQTLGYLAYLEREIAEATAQVEARRAAVAALVAETEPFEAEYLRRGWKRYFLVTNGNGHVHRGRACTTCFPTTRYGWLPALSGCDEAAMVAEYGEQACTVCFPAAPSLYQALKAQGLTRLSPQAAERQAAKAAREAKRAALAAKREAASIRTPDGGPLKGETWTISGWREAERELVTILGRAYFWQTKLGTPGWERLTGAEIEALTPIAARLVAALAAKHGIEPAAVRAKAVAKIAKEYGVKPDQVAARLAP
jgi:hypothetical protein